MRRLIVACVLPALVAAGCGSNEPDKAAPKSTGPSLEVKDPSSNIAGNVVTLPVSVKGLTIAKPDGDTSGKTGHFHVFIDREPVPAGQVIPKEKGIVHSADNPIKLYGLPVGRHRAVVVIGDGAHRRILPDVAEELSFTVDGPSVQASAPPTVRAGEAVPVTLTVEGLTVKAADGMKTPGTGHLHLFVDREPTPSGQAIPKEPGIVHTTETTVSVPGLAAGEHTIWVVAGDGAHVPLDPPVTARLTVTVQ